MPPEPGHRSHRHRSQTRSASRPRHHEARSPSREPPRRRPHHDVRPSYSPTRERSDPDLRSRERQRQERPGSHQRAKSRPPGSGRGSRDSRGKPSVKRPRVRFSMIDAEGAAETLTAKATQSGFLRKQADNEPGAWNEYYFVIKPLTYLFYYNAKDDETPRGIIDLEYLTDIKRNADCLQRAVGGGDHCFRVSGKLPRPSAEQTATGDVPKMRPLYLDTEDAGEAEKWMNAIRNHRFSAKKDEQFFETVHELQDAKLRIAQLEEEQEREAETKRNLRVKAKTLLQKMRAVDSGNAGELPDVDVDDLDDVADDMLAMLEGMEDVLISLQGKLDQQKQEIIQKQADGAGVTSTRRGFAGVIQRAVSRRENTSFLELSEDEEEETLAAIRSRRQRKPQKAQPAAIPEKPQERPVEKPKEKPLEKPRERSRQKSRDNPKEKVQEEAPALDNVSDVLAMWKAKKKKKSPTRKQSAFETDDEDDSTRGRSNRSLPTAQKSRGSDRSSEEDTVSLDSSDRDSGEKLPPGWTKHESRGYPGTYYYAHETGKVSWDVPTDDMIDSGRGDSDRGNNDRHDERISDHDSHSEIDDYDVYDEYDDNDHQEEEEVDLYPDTTRSVDTSNEYLSEYETDEETAGGTTSAAYRKKKPKPKSAWAFKLPKLLPTNAAQPAPTEAPASTSPIRRGFNHHEF
ncbi:hypothetical protein V7S43_017688 [Phytophthora oleae]|uniref:WW domain-containing protein n=1 Tax=Phytophthora oleae TaxID=2107226 RepID=A0ABD3EW84_9STRA